MGTLPKDGELLREPRVGHYLEYSGAYSTDLYVHKGINSQLVFTRVLVRRLPFSRVLCC